MVDLSKGEADISQVFQWADTTAKFRYKWHRNHNLMISCAGKSDIPPIYCKKTKRMSGEIVVDSVVFHVFCKVIGPLNFPYIPTVMAIFQL